MAARMVNAIARTIPTVAVFSAMCPLLVPGRRTFMGNNRRRCVSYFTLSLATLSQLTGQPKKRPKLLVRHILNWGPEEKAPPKRGLKCTGITPFRGRRASAAGQIRDTPASSRKEKPRQMTGLKNVMHGATQRVTQSKPHPFTFAGQHVQIGAGS
jgi:hypothetical protein